MRLLVTAFFLFFAGWIEAQIPYFQQRTDYKISVSLDDKKHQLDGKLELKYTNNSPHVLDKIGFHLWPNAYSTKSTAFAKQKRKQNSLKYHFAPITQMGNITELDFRVDQEQAKLMIDTKNPDMAWLILNQPLKPGQTIIIETPFQVKIPLTFSRLGHNGHTYEITQWYPKPAVYDAKGWHLMPYLDQGEFFSEFGNFDVNIHLPENYVVASTGELQDESEKRFLEEKVRQSSQAIANQTKLYDKDPESSSQYKTIRYLAENVHDFAWFASKRFYVQKSNCQVQVFKNIETWGFFENPKFWSKSAEYVKRAVEFYSANVGTYPWPQATAVEAALSAGGGMEYPMITVISGANDDASLDNVITHEVGHNWFYGILGSNEREHPFMDEGINTYYENRYMDSFYAVREGFLPRKWNKYLGNLDQNQLGFRVFQRSHLSQHPDQHSANFFSWNYGIDVYSNTGYYLEYLEKYWGKKKFDSAMKNYYNEWKFKHPYPEDLKASLEKNAGEDLSWLFEGLLQSDNKTDYAIRSLKKNADGSQLILKNHGKIAAPIKITAWVKDSIYFENWVPGFEREMKLPFPNRNWTKIELDRELRSTDLYPSNNTYRPNRLFPKCDPIRLSLLPLMEKPSYNLIGITPLVGWNDYNKWMLGALISNPVLPQQKFKWSLQPMYSTETKHLVGKLNLSYSRFIIGKPLYKIDFGLKAKQFAYTRILSDQQILNYNQLSPFVALNFIHDHSILSNGELKYQVHFIQDQVLNYSEKLPITDHVNNVIHQLKYTFVKTHGLGNLRASANLQYERYKIINSDKEQYLRLDLDCYKNWIYKKGRGVETRIFTSFFPLNSQRNSSFIAARGVHSFTRGSVGLSYQGYMDATNENFFFGRTAPEGIWSQQIAEFQGGFHVANGVAQRGNFGNTNTFLVAVNLSMDLPFPKVGRIIRPYVDLGYFKPSSDLIPKSEQTAFTSGIQLRLLRNYLQFNFPVFHSSNIRTLYQSQDSHNYFKEITFTCRFSPVSLINIINSIKLN